MKKIFLVCLCLIMIIGVSGCKSNKVVSEEGEGKKEEVHEPKSFSEDNWSTIISAVKSGNTSNYKEAIPALTFCVLNIDILEKIRKEDEKYEKLLYSYLKRVLNLTPTISIERLSLKWKVLFHLVDRQNIFY